jgi:hypothetical protein
MSFISRFSFVLGQTCYFLGCIEADMCPADESAHCGQAAKERQVVTVLIRAERAKDALGQRQRDHALVVMSCIELNL